MKTNSNKKSYICDIYQRSFERKSSFLRHKVTHNCDNKTIFKCGDCGQVFAHQDNYQQHKYLHQYAMDIVALAEEADDVKAAIPENAEKRFKFVL